MLDIGRKVHGLSRGCRVVVHLEVLSFTCLAVGNFLGYLLRGAQVEYLAIGERRLGDSRVGDGIVQVATHIAGDIASAVAVYRLLLRPVGFDGGVRHRCFISYAAAALCYQVAIGIASVGGLAVHIDGLEEVVNVAGLSCRLLHPEVLDGVTVLVEHRVLARLVVVPAHIALEGRLTQLQLHLHIRHIVYRPLHGVHSLHAVFIQRGVARTRLVLHLYLSRLVRARLVDTGLDGGAVVLAVVRIGVGREQRRGARHRLVVHIGGSREGVAAAVAVLRSRYPRGFCVRQRLERNLYLFEAQHFLRGVREDIACPIVGVGVLQYLLVFTEDCSTLYQGHAALEGVCAALGGEIVVGGGGGCVNTVHLPIVSRHAHHFALDGSGSGLVLIAPRRGYGHHPVVGVVRIVAFRVPQVDGALSLRLHRYQPFAHFDSLFHRGLHHVARRLLLYFARVGDLRTD